MPTRTPDGTPPQRSRGPWTAMVIVAVLALGVLALRPWVVDAPSSRREHDVAGAPTAAIKPTTPNTRPPGGAGLFGQPLPAETVEPRGRVETDDDVPAPAGPRPHPLHRRRGQDARDTRGTDRHTVFSTDVVTPYATGTESTIDDVPNLSGASGTISLCIQPQWGDRSQDDATLIRFGDDRVRLMKNVSFLRFEIVDQAGGTSGVGAPIGNWQPGEWHQVVATWDGGVIVLYVDGAQVMAAMQSGPIDLPPGTRVSIGSAFAAGIPVAPGTVAGVTIRDRALTPADVSQRFQHGPRPDE